MKLLNTLSAFAFAALLAAGPALYANDGVFYAVGNTLIPVKETVVRMDKEVLTLVRRGDLVMVTVDFTFYNPGPEKVEKVGFVTPPAGGDISEEDAQHPQIKDFTVMVNGEAAGFKVYRMEGSGYTLAEAVGYGDDFIYLFDVRFKEGLNRVVHTYAYRAAAGVDLKYGLEYRLTTGTMWAGGKIGDFTLNLHMTPGDYFMLPPSFHKDGRLANWTLEGYGRLGKERHEVMGAEYVPARVMQGYVTLHEKDFAPELDLFVGEFPMYDAVGAWTDGEMENPFLALSNYLAPWRTEEDKLGDLKTEQLRWLRNLPYAWGGYVFTSEDLNVFFGRFNWYVPVPGRKLEEIAVLPWLQDLVADVKAEEKRRKK